MVENNNYVIISHDSVVWLEVLLDWAGMAGAGWSRIAVLSGPAGLTWDGQDSWPSLSTSAGRSLTQAGAHGGGLSERPAEI